MLSIRDALLAGALALGAAALAPAALAQVDTRWNDQTCTTEVNDPSQLGVDKSLETPPRRGLKVNAKVHYISGRELICYGSEENCPFRLLDSIVQAGVLDALGIKEGGNITAYGYVTTFPPAPGKYLYVLNIAPRREDKELFREQIGKLEAAGDMAGLYALGEKIEAQGKILKQAASYKPIAQEAYRAGIGLKERALKPDDAQGWISVAADDLRLLGDRQAALDRLVKAIPPGGATPPPEVARMLQDVNAVTYGGQWMLFEKMKEAEGFILRDGAWVRKEQAQFEDIIAQQRKLPIRPRSQGNLPEFYQRAAAQGGVQNVLLGMTKEEVAQAIGFPAEIDRERKGADVYDMWTYDSFGPFYFETLPGRTCELFRKPDAPK
ncbi:MAG TPA: hypothetical protein VHF22_09215 [Planctomycetota bacterium]|nr:hypothetical protein [Planctomycetota bacterium]